MIQTLIENIIDLNDVHCRHSNIHHVLNVTINWKYKVYLGVDAIIS